MAVRQKKSIKDLLDRETEKPVLESLYVHYGVASDQLRRAPDVLAALTNSFNAIVSGDFGPSTILRYILNRRKKADWPRLGPQARKFKSVKELLTDSDLAALGQIYVEMDETSDELLLRPKAQRELARRFTALTGKQVPADLLIAAIFAKRKRGEWVKLREPAPAAFADIDEVA